MFTDPCSYDFCSLLWQMEHISKVWQYLFPRHLVHIIWENLDVQMKMLTQYFDIWIYEHARKYFGRRGHNFQRAETRSGAM